jgi:hypothetical protein
MPKAVITGDIIHSTKMSPKRLYTLFEMTEKELQELTNAYNMQYELFRGDSFQCLVHQARYSLRITLLLKMFIRSLAVQESGHESGKKSFKSSKVTDARMAIGIGEAEVFSKRLATANGTAFQLSGRALDQLKDARQHLIIDSNDTHKQEWLTASILLDALIARTSGLQCQVLYYKLKGLTETDIGKALHIGQSAVNQRARSGNWVAFSAMLNRFEEVYAVN